MSELSDFDPEDLQPSNQFEPGAYKGYDFDLTISPINEDSSPVDPSFEPPIVASDDRRPPAPKDDYAESEARYLRLIEAGVPGAEELLRASRISRLGEAHGDPDLDFCDQSISDLIALRQTIDGSPLQPALRENEVTTGVFIFLRDTHHAQTVGEALDIVRAGHVPKEVVALWIEEGAVDTGELNRAMAAAYPELASEIKSAVDRFTALFERASSE